MLQKLDTFCEKKCQENQPEEGPYYLGIKKKISEKL